MFPLCYFYNGPWLVALPASSGLERASYETLSLYLVLYYGRCCTLLVASSKRLRLASYICFLAETSAAM
jgi:hypothetical protein